MMKGRGTRRSWVKFWVKGWLHGSIRWQLEPAERGVWADLICLAGECNRAGEICDNDGRPFPLEFLANQLNIPIALLGQVIASCQHEGRLDNKDGILKITNWVTYQSEYERQKPYREKKKFDQGGRYQDKVARTREDVEERKALREEEAAGRESKEG